MGNLQPSFVALLLVVAGGAATQRVSGLGFALVAAPALVLFAGAYEGVLIVNLLGLLVGLSMLLMTWRDIWWPWGRILVPAGLAGVVPGAIAARVFPPAPLQVTVGALVLGGLLATVLAAQLRVGPGWGYTAGAGAASGFLAAAAGVGGPVLAAWARAAGLAHRQYVATAQLSLVAQAALALAIKGLPALAVAELSLLAGATVAGLVAGQALAGLLPTVWSRRVTLAVAAAGASAVVGRGLVTW